MHHMNMIEPLPAETRIQRSYQQPAAPAHHRPIVEPSRSNLLRLALRWWWGSPTAAAQPRGLQVGDVLNGLQLSQDANELSANQMALIIPLQTLSSLPRVCQGRFQHFLTKISTHLAKFSGTYFHLLSQQACSLFRCRVHTSSSGPSLEMPL